MSTHKYIDKICCAALAMVLVLTVLFVNGEALGLRPASRAMGYESRLFDVSRVHTIDIVMDDWEGFLSNCTKKEYTACSLVIDGDAYKNAAIRGKGSYSMRIASYEGKRYSFKIEFDHYDGGNTYYGLDKLSLNNISMDNTYMKDYLAYRLMGQFGVASPLCSYVYITANGQEVGLYLAVEGVEDAFLRRNYGSSAGKLYKPDSSAGFGGWGEQNAGNSDGADASEEPSFPDMDVSAIIEKLPADSKLAAALKELPEGTTFWTMWEKLPEDTDFSSAMEELEQVIDFSSLFGERDTAWEDDSGDDDVKLKYVDDNPDSYPNIFDNAKTEITDADKTRLIASLKALNSGENVEGVVDVEQVVRYLVVHNFVQNADSYTGSMVHNYYLHEKDGVLSLIPWDYNLAFGDGFNPDATAGAVVNAPIDSPVTGGDLSDRPMVAWIFNSGEYTALYHRYYKEFLSAYAGGGKLKDMIDEASALISPYVEKDPTKTCTYEEYEAGVSALKEFCRLRAESAAGQLDGSIPSTGEGQAADSSALIDASSVTLTDMGAAAVVGGEEDNDIAVLKIDAADLQPVVLGDSGAVEVGENVYAIGNPLGELTFTLTGGLVSAKDRAVTTSDGSVMNMIQTDTAINSGNSGGPLFDRYGQVIGIVSAKLSGSGSASASVEGLGFAIPLNDVKDMVTSIIQNGYVAGKPNLGIIMGNVTGFGFAQNGNTVGCQVLAVLDGSCADESGLQAGDIITAVDGEEVVSGSELSAAVRKHQSGDEISLTVLRGGKTSEMTVVLDENDRERQEAMTELQNRYQASDPYYGGYLYGNES